MGVEEWHHQPEEDESQPTVSERFVHDGVFVDVVVCLSGIDSAKVQKNLKKSKDDHNKDYSNFAFGSCQSVRLV